jgi:hypothetical protein
MSAAATLRALDVLRREVAVGQGMSSIRIVAVDVGVVSETPVSALANSLAMDDWTPSEKATYGQAFAALGETSMGRSRRPEDISVLVDNIVGVISAGTKTKMASQTIWGIRVGVGYEKIRDWIRGDRFAVGAGGSSSFSLFHAYMRVKNRCPYSRYIHVCVIPPWQAARWIIESTPPIG